MRITKRQLRRLIREELEYCLAADHPEEVEAVEDTWAGGENIHLDIDHAKALGAEEVTDHPEILVIVDTDD
jgi:hypothetical protein